MQDASARGIGRLARDSQLQRRRDRAQQRGASGRRAARRARQGVDQRGQVREIGAAHDDSARSRRAALSRTSRRVVIDVPCLTKPRSIATLRRSDAAGRDWSRNRPMSNHSGMIATNRPPGASRSTPSADAARRSGRRARARPRANRAGSSARRSAPPRDRAVRRSARHRGRRPPPLETVLQGIRGGAARFR